MNMMWIVLLFPLIIVAYGLSSMLEKIGIARVYEARAKYLAAGGKDD